MSELILHRASSHLSIETNSITLELVRPTLSFEAARYTRPFSELVADGVVRRPALVLMFVLCIYSGLHAQDNSFAAIIYDSAVGYNFAMTRMRTTILRKDSTLDETTILPGKRLSPAEVDGLLKIVNNKRTYGGAPFACFEPKHAFIFYRRNSIVGRIEICFACNNIRSSPDIPAVNYYFNKSGMTVARYGFSERGSKKLKEFCRRIGLRVD